jgi:hypothetical protein
MLVTSRTEFTARLGPFAEIRRIAYRARIVHPQDPFVFPLGLLKCSQWLKISTWLVSTAMQDNARGVTIELVEEKKDRVGYSLCFGEIGCIRICSAEHILTLHTLHLHLRDSTYL